LDEFETFVIDINIVKSKVFVLMLAFCGVLAGCSSSSSSSDSAPTTPLLEDTTIELNGSTAMKLDTPPPSASDSALRPVPFSSPDIIEFSADSPARIELGYRTPVALSTLYLSVDGESGHMQVPVSETAEGNQAGSDLKSLILFITIDNATSGTPYCYRLQVSDTSALISDASEICLVLGETDVLTERLIYLSDFESNSSISTLSLDTGNITNIGQTGFNLTDIAFLNDRLYGVTFSQLVEIDASTADATIVGSLGISGVNGLEGRDDTLYASTISGEIFSINPLDATTEFLVDLPAGTGSSGDLVFEDGGSRMFGTVRQGGIASDLLIEVDLANSTTQLLGEIGFNNVWGLVHARDQLVGLTISGEFLLLDSTDGQGVFVEQTNALSASGATLAP
jgi:hypothetical protein